MVDEHAVAVTTAAAGDSTRVPCTTVGGLVFTPIVCTPTGKTLFFDPTTNIELSVADVVVCVVAAVLFFGARRTLVFAVVVGIEVVGAGAKSLFIAGFVNDGNVEVLGVDVVGKKNGCVCEAIDAGPPCKFNQFL